MKPSKFHTNRRWHNWIVYDLIDKSLDKYSKHFKGHIVDLGCGEAFFKSYYLNFADNYTGIDWSDSYHNTAADIISDLNINIDLDDEVADTIISISVMEHLYAPQIFLNESYRILKCGGKMILQVPWQWWVHEEPHDYFRYSPYALEYLFKKAGFTDINVEAQCGFFTTWILKINYFSLRFIKGPKFVRWIIKGILLPFWTAGQILAPYLDKLDRNWEAETQGYIVLARKK